MDFDQTLQYAKSIADEAIKELDSLIDKSLNMDLTIPAYDEIRKNSKNFYTLYGEMIDFFNDINKSILNATQLNMTLKEVVNGIAGNKNFNFTVTKEYLAKFKMLKTKIDEKLVMVKEFKTSLEFTIKFYQNTQFLLSTTY